MKQKKEKHEEEEEKTIVKHNIMQYGFAATACNCSDRLIFFLFYFHFARHIFLNKQRVLIMQMVQIFVVTKYEQRTEKKKHLNKV